MFSSYQIQKSILQKGAVITTSHLTTPIRRIMRAKKSKMYDFLIQFTLSKLWIVGNGYDQHPQATYCTNVQKNGCNVTSRNAPTNNECKLKSRWLIRDSTSFLITDFIIAYSTFFLSFLDLLNYCWDGEFWIEGIKKPIIN
jgi:hypothetical protein